MTDPITITEIPAITPLPVIDRTQPPSVVRPQVDTYFGTQLPTFTGQLNAVSEAIVQLGQDVLALRQATAADKSAAEGFKTQAGLYASAADTARGLAVAEKEAAALERAAAEDARGGAQDARDAAQTFANTAGAAVGLPAPLASRPLAILRVNAAGTGTEATYEAQAGDIKRISIAESTAINATQKGALIDVSGSGITLTFDAAALGNGWWCYLRIVGSTAVTASAAAGQTIDGVASGVIKPGMTLLVQCDGANFHCVRVGPRAKEVLTSGTSWVVPLGCRTVQAKGESGSGNGAGSYLAGGGGGAGFEQKISTTPGAAATYAIGAAGGGATSFALSGVTLAASGGQTATSTVGAGGEVTSGFGRAGQAGLTGSNYNGGPAAYWGRGGHGNGSGSGIPRSDGTAGRIELEY